MVAGDFAPLRLVCPDPGFAVAAPTADVVLDLALAPHIKRRECYLGYFTSHHAGSMPLSFSMRSADSLPLRRATHWFFIQL